MAEVLRDSDKVSPALRTVGESESVVIPSVIQVESRRKHTSKLSHGFVKMETIVILFPSSTITNGIRSDGADISISVKKPEKMKCLTACATRDGIRKPGPEQLPLRGRPRRVRGMTDNEVTRTVRGSNSHNDEAHIVCNDSGLFLAKTLLVLAVHEIWLVNAEPELDPALPGRTTSPNQTNKVTRYVGTRFGSGLLDSKHTILKHRSLTTQKLKAASDK